MSFAKNTRILSIAAAAMIISGAAFAQASDPANASLSPATQMDWDNAHRDAYAASGKAAKDERLLAKSNRATGDAQNADAAQVAQVKTQDAPAKPAK